MAVPMVEIPKPLYILLRGFLNQFASACKDCLHRDPYSCSQCGTVSQAVELMHRLDHAAEGYHDCAQDDDRLSRCAQIVDAVAAAGRPVRAYELRANGDSKQQIHAAIQYLVRHGHLLKLKEGSSVPTYVMGTVDFFTTTNKKGK